MTTDTTAPAETPTGSDNVLDWTPAPALIETLADRVTAFYGKTARLNEVCETAAIEQWLEIGDLNAGQIEALYEEVVEELAARDNGKRR